MAGGCIVVYKKHHNATLCLYRVQSYIELGSLLRIKYTILVM